MTRISPRTLLPAVFAIMASIPSAAFAQGTPTGAARAPEAPDAMNTQDRDALAAAELLANEASQIIERWITTQVLTEDRLFARLYFPLPKTEPQKFSTTYDHLADRDLLEPEERVLARSPAFQYAIVTDINGYVPTHNTAFTQALTGKANQDYANNRTKRILADIPSLVAARSETRYLIQRTKVETGDVIYDVSVPVFVRGKHWGCVRVGYRRIE